MIGRPEELPQNESCEVSLDFNKGKKPNVWPIIEGTPAGVALHFIDENIDTGPIIARKEVLIEPTETAYSLYHKLIDEKAQRKGITEVRYIEPKFIKKIREVDKTRPNPQSPQLVKDVKEWFIYNEMGAVSYTHLTLPTILLV